MALTDEKQGQITMAIAMVISGTIGYFVLKSGQSPLNVVFFRCVIGGVGLAGYCLFKGYLKNLHLSKLQLFLLFAGAITLIFNWVFLFTAYNLTSIGITTIIYHLQPFFLLFFSMLALKEKFSRSSFCWLAVAFFGLAVIVSPEGSGFDSRFLLGCASALCAAMLYAITTLMTKKLSGIVRPEVIATSHMAIGAVIFLFLADFSKLPEHPEAWRSIFILGAFHTTIMYLMLYTAFKKASTSSLAILGFIYPIVAVVVDYYAFGHLIKPHQVIGAALILAAGISYNRGVRFPIIGRRQEIKT